LYNLLYIKNLNETTHDEFIDELVPYLDAWFNWWIDIQEVDGDDDSIEMKASSERLLTSKESQ